MIKKFFHLVTTLILLSLTLTTQASNKIPLIVTTDMGSDDVIALLYLIKSPRIAIKAILIDGNGSTHCPAGANNALRLLTLMHTKLIPVACGATKALGLGHTFSKASRHRYDVLLNQQLPKTNRQINKDTAAALMVRLISQSKKPITILSIGSLTTLAQALKTDKKIKQNIDRIVIMGGAIDAPGNVVINNKNLPAEWNIYFDPVAAKYVFQSHLNITLMPLDVTNTMPITDSFLNKMKSINSITTNLISDILHYDIDMIKNHTWYFWDPLAAVIVSHPQLCTYQAMNLDVCLNPKNKLAT